MGKWKPSHPAEEVKAPGSQGTYQKVTEKKGADPQPAQTEGGHDPSPPSERESEIRGNKWANGPAALSEGGNSIPNGSIILGPFRGTSAGDSAPNGSVIIGAFGGTPTGDSVPNGSVILAASRATSTVDSVPNGSVIMGASRGTSARSNPQRAPPNSSIVEDGSSDWKLSLNLFSSKKRANPKEDKKLPRRIRRYYKAQDELITSFEEMQLEVDDAMENSEAQTKLKKTASTMAKVSFFVNLLLLIAKAVVAVITGSLAIISSLIDSVVDILSGALMWWSNRAIKNRDPYHYPQGRTKLEPIAIVILAVVMAVASVLIVQEALKRIVGYATTDVPGPLMPLSAIIIGAITIAAKFILWMLCRRIQTPSVQALAQDHRNDVFSNTVAVACGYIGYKYWNFADPIGAIVISLYIIASWFSTGMEQIKMLTGHTASPDFLKKITWIALNHHKKVKHIETVRAFHFGNNFLVEVDIVLPKDMRLHRCHNIGESLQGKLERLPQVERAFVHIDFEYEHSPSDEHKIV